MANQWQFSQLTFRISFVIGVLTIMSVRTWAQEPQCRFTLSNVSFGTVDPAKPDLFDAVGAFSYVCTSDPKEILRICPSLGGMENDGTRWMTDTVGNRLSYNLYTDVDRNAVWGSWDSDPVRGATIEIPAGRPDRIKINGSKSIYGRIIAEQQGVPTGLYKAMIDGTKITVSYGYAAKGGCSTFKNGTKLNASLTVSAKVTTTASAWSAGGLPGTSTQQLLLHTGLQDFQPVSSGDTQKAATMSGAQQLRTQTSQRQEEPVRKLPACS